MAARLLLLLGLVAMASPGGPPPAPVTHTVLIEGTSFRPASLTIKPGDSVVWTNNDVVAHTATAEGQFDSKRIDPEKSWKRTFATKGSFRYICTYHVGMKGELVVK